jgi:4-amino-4-deoxy-L-arabinose transferase-like glycosyltransferase
LQEDPVAAMKVVTRQPGFAGLLLLTHRIVGPYVGGETPEAWQRCGELLALAGGAAACVAVYALTRRLFDELTARLAGLLAVLWPQGAHTSAAVLSEMPGLALFLFGLLLIYDALLRPHGGRLLAGGIVVGLCYMMRQEALALLLAGGFGWWRWSQVGVRRRGLGVGLLLLGFVLVVAPHSILTGRWMPNKNPLDFLKLFAQNARPIGEPTLAYVVSWWMAPGRLIEEWLRSGRYAMGLLFLLGAAWKAAPPAESQGRRLIIATVVLHAALLQARASVYGEVSDRYVVIPAALCMPWAASGWLAMLRFVQQRASRARGLAALCVALIVPMAPLILYVARPVYGGKEHYRRAGQWLRLNAAGGDRVLAHEHLEQILYYAGRTYPATTWIRCGRGDDLKRLEAVVARDRPQWFVDAEGTHRGELDEGSHFAALQGGAVPSLRTAWVAGPPGRQVHVLRVQP